MKGFVIVVLLILSIAVAGCIGCPLAQPYVPPTPTPLPTPTAEPTITPPPPTPTPLPTPVVTPVPQGPRYEAPRVRVQFVENGMASVRIDNPSNTADSYDVYMNDVLYQRTQSVAADGLFTLWVPVSGDTNIRVVSAHGGGSTSVVAK